MFEVVGCSDCIYRYNNRYLMGRSSGPIIFWLFFFYGCFIVVNSPFNVY